MKVSQTFPMMDRVLVIYSLTTLKVPRATCPFRPRRPRDRGPRRGGALEPARRRARAARRAPRRRRRAQGRRGRRGDRGGVRRDGGARRARVGGARAEGRLLRRRVFRASVRVFSHACPVQQWSTPRSEPGAGGSAVSTAWYWRRAVRGGGVIDGVQWVVGGRLTPCTQRGAGAITRRVHSPRPRRQCSSSSSTSRTATRS